jgi:hypothetical protein
VGAVIVAVIVSAACIAASLRRLVFVYDALSFDPEGLLRELRGDAGRARAPAMLDRLVLEAPPERDRDLFEALTARGDERAALLGQALMELDFRFVRWARVPRVCASIASSAGFLLASWALRLALVGAPAPTGAEDAFKDALERALVAALGVVAVGAVGTVTCLAIFYEARRVSRVRREATDKLVERLERIGGDDPPPASSAE